MRVMLRNISDSVNIELINRRVEMSESRLFGDDAILQQNLGFYERFMQPMEDPKRLPDAVDDLEDPHRWLTPDLEHSGDQGEVCLFRTFVNAQIGPKGSRMKSSDLPYMLVLWCLAGRSEIVVSLLNQHKTINLFRNLTAEDIKRHEGDMEPREGFRIEFPSQDTVVKFLSLADQNEFLDYSRKYFEDIERRRPLPGEFFAFRDGLRSCKLRNPSTTSGHTFQEPLLEASAPCEITLYGLIPDKVWKTTRRLVISSSPATRNRWCFSRWLPLHKVQVQENGRQVSLIWSDCDHLERTTDGRYISHWSYVWKPDQPNRILELEFDGLEAAGYFVNCILRPYETPYATPYVKLAAQYASPSAAQEVQIYDLCDINETGGKGYNAVVFVRREPSVNYSCDVYFVHRDFDFDFKDTTKYLIEFPNLPTPQYTSDKTDFIYEPKQEDGDNPNLADVELLLSSSSFAFDSHEDRVKVIEHLVGWKLTFCRQALAVHLKVRGHLLSESHERLLVSIWEKTLPQESSSRHVLAMRSSRKRGGAPPWITAQLSGLVSIKEAGRKSKVVLSNLAFRRGDMIDSGEMSATGRVVERIWHPERKWAATVMFDDKNVMRDFVEKTRVAVDELPL